MLKNILLAVTPVLLAAILAQAGPYKALSNYHMFEAARTGNLDNLNQGMLYNQVDRMQEQRKQREEESRREEEARIQKMRDDDRQLEIQRLKQQVQAAPQLPVVKPAVVKELVAETPQLNREVAPQVVNLVPQYGTSTRRKFNDPVLSAKKAGGEFFWDEGVCKQKLPNGDVEVHYGEAIVIRLCRGKGGPDDINAAYEKYEQRQVGLINKKFTVLEEDTLKGSRTCTLVTPKEKAMSFDVICKGRVALRMPVKSLRLDTPEAKQALKDIKFKMQNSRLFTEDKAIPTDREMFFNSVD